MNETAGPCERFGHVDPVAYLVDRDADEFATWKDHFLDCPECSAALAAASELEWQLGELGNAHPDAVELDAYALGHGLDVAERARVDAHVQTCPLCGDQLRALSRFERATSAVGARRPASGSLERSGLAAWLDVLGDWLRPVPSPVWAAALVLILFALYRVGMGTVDEATTTPPIAVQVEHEGEDGFLAPKPATPSGSEGAAPRSGSLAEHGSPIAPTEILEDRRGIGTTTPNQEMERPELLLATLELPATLDYRGSGLGSGRFDVIGRGARPTPGAATPIQALAPKDHRGLAATAAGILVWSLPNARSETVRLIVVDDRKIDPVYEVAIEGPHVAGLHAIDLAAQGVALEPGVDYVWSVALEIDPDRPSRSPRSRAVLGLVDPSEDPAQRLAAAGPSDRIGVALAQGFWYDGVSDLTRAAADHSDPSPFRVALGKLARAQGIVVEADPSLTMHRP